jgi:hypothetical protein
MKAVAVSAGGGRSCAIETAADNPIVNIARSLRKEEQPSRLFTATNTEHSHV